MFTIYDEATDAVYGTLDETQLQFLMDHLEEESAEDTDFYINQATVDMLEQDGADAGLAQAVADGPRRARGHGYSLGPKLNGCASFGRIRFWSDFSGSTTASLLHPYGSVRTGSTGVS